MEKNLVFILVNVGVGLCILAFGFYLKSVVGELYKTACDKTTDAEARFSRQLTDLKNDVEKDIIKIETQCCSSQTKVNKISERLLKVETRLEVLAEYDVE